ncbi:hypothetical protein [Frigoriglobus tundricola]|uniref:Uncharacterized protein n=1 Tax=Frigoriglobus tundricola TaxID=2774151 RepID=A0A6M5Z347_9BACT|nr:hypothetical protein [Frigoriglobus tundricola]QJX00840.1 hypothetical protein FTUN_8478 [Frigoriglobus tundricola]
MRELMSLAILIGTAMSAMVLLAALVTHGFLVVRGRQSRHERSWPRLFTPTTRDARDSATRALPISTDPTPTVGRAALSICPDTRTR